MQSFCEADIERLIFCPKRIQQQPRREMKLEWGHFRNDMILESKDGTDKFSVFMRKCEHFHENFSIGLRWTSRDGFSLTLFRCNGPHGGHIDIKNTHHFFYHTHIVTSDDLNSGILAERHATIVTAYASYEDAVIYFLKQVKVDDSDIERYYAKREPLLPLFPDEDE